MAPNRPSVKHVPLGKHPISENDISILLRCVTTKMPYTETDGVSIASFVDYRFLNQRCDIQDIVIDSATKKLYHTILYGVNTMISPRLIRFNEEGF